MSTSNARDTVHWCCHFLSRCCGLNSVMRTSAYSSAWHRMRVSARLDVAARAASLASWKTRLECAEPRVKDVNFDRGELTSRDGKPDAGFTRGPQPRLSDGAVGRRGALILKRFRARLPAQSPDWLQAEPVCAAASYLVTCVPTQ
jgi:hypothetical protein